MQWCTKVDKYQLSLSSSPRNDPRRPLLSRNGAPSCQIYTTSIILKFCNTFLDCFFINFLKLSSNDCDLSHVDSTNRHIFHNTIMILILYSIHACFCSWLIGLGLYVLFFGSFCSVKTYLWNDTSWIPLCHVIHKDIYVGTSFNATFIAILPFFVISNLTAIKILILLSGWTSTVFGNLRCLKWSICCRL